jgi:outer membrane protein assembly factor BamB
MQKLPGQIVFKRLREGLARPLAHRQATWSLADLDVNSVALAANAVVAATATGHKELKSGDRLKDPRGPAIQYDGWQVSAFDRQNGQPLWSVPLPEEPLYDGLAIAADGTVLVTLRDGTIVGVR